MKQTTIAICDEQDTYRERLAEYFMHKRKEQVRIFTFSKKPHFLSMQKEEPFDIVLWGKGFEQICPKEKDDSLYIYLSDIPDWPKDKNPAIFKYQSAEEIFRCIFGYYLEEGKINPGVSHGLKEIIGIYSPTHSRLRTPFALTFAQVLADEKKILYVNLGEWAGFRDWFQEEYHRDLADLLYLISGYGCDAQGLLESVVHTVNHMDYIPPMTDAQLLCETGREEYRKLLNLLVEKTDYEVLLLDFGIMVPGFFSLLEQCTGIYIVVDQGIMAKGQCRQFEESMMKDGMEHLAQKLEYVSFSGADVQIMEGEPVLQQWLYGELGDRARATRYIKSGTD